MNSPNDFNLKNPKTLILIIAIGFLSFVLPIFVLSLMNSNKAEAANWFNDHWQYRQKLIIDNSGVEQIDKYVTVTANTSDTTKLQADCGDIRFMKGNGEILPYYIVSGCGTASTIIHINFDVIQVGDNLNYIYYGNEGAENGFETNDFTNGEAATYTPTLNSTVENSPGPVAYWSFDDPSTDSGQGIPDLTGNGNDGQLGSTTGVDASDPKWVDEGMCVSGKCLEFDGVDDAVRFGDISDLDKQFTEFSFSSWVKPYSGISNQRFIAGKMGASGQRGWQFGIEPDYRVIITYFNSSNGSSQSLITDIPIKENEWSHIGFIYKSSDYLEIHINGKVVKILHSGVHATFNSSNSAYFQIGNRGDSIGTQFFPGFIDEPKIYPYARSAEEIKSDYIRGASKNGSNAVLGVQDTAYLDDGLVGYWPMDENTGINAIADISGNGNDLVMTGSMTEDDWVPGKFGSALDFDGINDHGVAANSSILSPSSDMSISAWVKLDNLATVVGDTQKIAFQRHSMSPYDSYSIEQYIYLGENRFRFVWRDSGGTSYSARTSNSCLTLATNTWYHVMGVRDGANIAIYINGDPSCGAVSPPDLTDTIYPANDDFKIGAEGLTNEPLDGIIDEVKLYNYARTQEQVLQDMSGNNVSSESQRLPEPIAHWGFDEGYGSVAHDDGLNSNDGTISGATFTEGKISKALSFDGVDDFVAMPHINSITYDGSYTFSTWIYANDSIGRGNVIFENSNGNTDRNGMSFRDGHLRFGYYDGLGWHGKSGSMSANVWHHVVGVNHRTDLTLYIDGIVQSGVENTYVATNGQLLIGRNNLDADTFNGLIDEIKIYNTALTQDQVKQDYNLGASTNFSSGTDEKEMVTGVSSSTSGPVAYWNFDENSGTGANAVHDISGNNKHGTMHASMTESDWVPGKKGSAMSFDGVDDRVESSSMLDISGSESRTISVWFKQNTLMDKNIFGFGANASTNLFDIVLIGGKLVGHFHGTGNDTITGAPSYDVNKWNHAIITYDGTTVDVYLNGVYANSKTINLNTTDSTFIIGGGKYPTYNYFNGLIDEVKIYDYALSPSQIAYEYNRGAPVAWYKLDECQGNTAFDSSGNKNHGTLNIGASGTNTSSGTCESGVGSEAWNNGSNGKLNSSLDFDGVDDYISLGVDTFSNITGNTTPITSMAWVKTSSGGDILTEFEGGVCGAYTFGLNGSGIPYITNGQSNSTLGVTSLNDNMWHHLTYVYNGIDGKIYVDGYLDTTDSSSPPSWYGACTAQEVLIGARYNGGAEFDGQIDDVRIYNYALSEGQIKQVMNGGAGVRFE